MSEEILDRAAQLLKEGDPLAAQALVAEAAHEAVERFGAESVEYATALFEQSHVHGAVGDLRQAAATLRQACDIRSDDEEATRDRLTYSMNLGEVLLRLGELDEAEERLGAALAEREALYGADHPGTAFGMEPLADVLRAQGRLEDAAELIGRAVTILRVEGHPRIADALAVQAGIDGARGAEPFANVSELPDELLDRLVTAVMQREPMEDPAVYLKVLLELEDLVKDTRGNVDLWLVNINAAVANAARAVGEHGIRIEALTFLSDAVRGDDDPEQRLTLVQGLALAHDEAGDTETAEETYGEAIAIAERSGDAALRSGVLRNLGLFHSQLDRLEDAERNLRAAVSVADEGDGIEAAGRARVALGVFLQHGGELDEAQPLLERGIEQLDSSHSESLYGQGHLDALLKGGACGCGDLNLAYGAAIRELIEPHLPEDLLAEVGVELTDEGPTIHVGLTRAPSEDEQALLQQLLEQANTSLRRKIMEEGTLS